MKKIIILILSIISLIYIVKNNNISEEIIPNEAIRFRVISNSNTIYDQNIKIQIRNILQNKILDLIKDSKSINQTRKILNEHKQELYELTNNKLKELNYDKDFELTYGYNYFPEKNYRGVKYKAGKYESLVVKLGEGKGENFWCVLFPPLCMLEENETGSDNEYKFFIKEIINKYFN